VDPGIQAEEFVASEITYLIGKPPMHEPAAARLPSGGIPRLWSASSGQTLAWPRDTSSKTQIRDSGRRLNDSLESRMSLEWAIFLCVEDKVCGRLDAECWQLRLDERKTYR
jgi:hypothetical protein